MKDSLMEHKCIRKLHLYTVMITISNIQFLKSEIDPIR